MKYDLPTTTLGRTGLTVPEICLGTMTWGSQNTEAEAFAQMDYAMDHGVNFFDTAELYATVPVTPAILNAVRHATGMRVYTMPADPDSLKAAMMGHTAAGTSARDAPPSRAEAGEP